MTDEGQVIKDGLTLKTKGRHQDSQQHLAEDCQILLLTLQIIVKPLQKVGDCCLHLTKRCYQV